MHGKSTLEEKSGPKPLSMSISESKQAINSLFLMHVTGIYHRTSDLGNEHVVGPPKISWELS